MTEIRFFICSVCKSTTPCSNCNDRLSVTRIVPEPPKPPKPPVPTWGCCHTDCTCAICEPAHIHKVQNKGRTVEYVRRPGSWRTAIKSCDIVVQEKNNKAYLIYRVDDGYECWRHRSGSEYGNSVYTETFIWYAPDLSSLLIFVAGGLADEREVRQKNTQA